MMAKVRTAIFISGGGSNMRSLVEASQAANFPAQIILVLSNRPDAGGLAYAAEQGIATVCLDHKTFKTRADFDSEAQAVLERFDIELVCLAGFMRLLTPDFVNAWPGRMINIHPALLPAYKGLHTHERALADKVKEHGCTVHFVTPEMDEGEIILQRTVVVLETDTPATLAARVLQQEHLAYPEALRLVSQRLQV